MYLLATGTYTDPSKLPALLQSEIEKVRELREQGLLLRGYRHADGSGVFLVLKAESVEEAREKTGQLPFVKAGLLKIAFAEITPF